MAYKYFKRICLIIFFISGYFAPVYATTYYISNSGNDVSSGVSMNAAWKSLVKLQEAANAGIIKTGDEILFKRGDVFTGTLKWTTIWGQNCATGTVSQPIRFAAYGVGAKPVFKYPPGSVEKSENRILMLFAGVDHIIVEDIAFVENLIPQTAKINASNCAVPLYFGAMDEATSNHCIVKAVTISGCGNGIVLIGNYNEVLNCSLTNFGNIKNTFKTTEGTQYDDYGANAFTISGDDNLIDGNFIRGAWAESEDFGWNGGAFEMFNHCNRNRIANNTIIDCGGLAEFGAQRKEAFSKDNVFAFNKVINCGGLTWCNIAGVFKIDVSNIIYKNNSIIENDDSRFSGPNTGKGLINPGPKSLAKPEKVLFAFNGNPSASNVFNLQQNIFYIQTRMDLINPDAASKSLHDGNIIYLPGGGQTNLKLNTTEQLLTASPFRYDFNGDPFNWNLELKKDNITVSVGAVVNVYRAIIESAYLTILATWLYHFIAKFHFVQPDITLRNIRSHALWLNNWYSWLWK